MNKENNLIAGKTPLEIATLFHDTYERLAPSFGYETRPDTKEFDPTTNNGKLMMATCSEVVSSLNRVVIEILDMAFKNELGNKITDFRGFNQLERIGRYESQEKILEDIRNERKRQDAMWGVQDHDNITWSAILSEECGEFAQAALHEKFGGEAAEGLREELIQVAAVATQIVECFDRAKAKNIQPTDTNQNEEVGVSTEKEIGTTDFLKLSISTINRILVNKKICSEYELVDMLKNETELYKQYDPIDELCRKNKL